MILTRNGSAPPGGGITGTWSASNYACYDANKQVIFLTEQIAIAQNGTNFTATKITGDDCVPAGHETFNGSLPAATAKTAPNKAAPAPNRTPQSFASGSCPPNIASWNRYICNPTPENCAAAHDKQSAAWGMLCVPYDADSNPAGAPSKAARKSPKPLKNAGNPINPTPPSDVAADSPSDNGPADDTSCKAGGHLEGNACWIIGLTHDDCTDLGGRIVEREGYQYCAYPLGGVTPGYASAPSRPDSDLRDRLKRAIGGDNPNSNGNDNTPSTGDVTAPPATPASSASAASAPKPSQEQQERQRCAALGSNWRYDPTADHNFVDSAPKCFPVFSDSTKGEPGFGPNFDSTK